MGVAGHAPKQSSLIGRVTSDRGIRRHVISSEKKKIKGKRKDIIERDKFVLPEISPDSLTR